MRPKQVTKMLETEMYEYQCPRCGKTYTTSFYGSDYFSFCRDCRDWQAEQRKDVLLEKLKSIGITYVEFDDLEEFSDTSFKITHFEIPSENRTYVFRVWDQETMELTIIDDEGNDNVKID